MKKFTKREKDLLIRLLEGKTNKEIANDLGLQPQTIKNEFSRIFRKVKVRNRTELALKVVRDNEFTH